MSKKKFYSSEEKAMILREHLEKNVPISELAEKYDLHPNIVYIWKKQLFEQAPQILSRSRTKAEERKITDQERRIAELEALLAKRESLITDLVEDMIAIKKNFNGTDLTKNGLNPKSGIR
jgi:transposase-like protein